MNPDDADALAAAPSRSVVSSDGTTITYVTQGAGPPVIVVPGALETAADFATFASLLGRSHTVHTIERRGRGRSGPQGVDYAMARECEDLAAVQKATASTFIFGHSFGGLIALEAALTNSAFLKVAVYEPGVSVRGSIPVGWIDACERDLAAGKPLDAFARFTVAAGPGQARRNPVWLMKLLLPLVIGAARRRTIFNLFPTTLAEHRVIGELDNSCLGYRRLRAEVLAMYGGRSGLDWVPKAIAALVDVLPSVVVRKFPSCDHFGPLEGGSGEVAGVIADFLSADGA